MQPVELARKLAKEMDDHKTISIHRVYVPDEYTIFLNPADREQFAAYETQMRNELAEYLVEHARREGYSLSARPLVLLETERRADRGNVRHRRLDAEPGLAADAAGAAAPAPEPTPPRHPPPAAGAHGAGLPEVSPPPPAPMPPGSARGRRRDR